MFTLSIEHAITDVATWKSAFDRFADARAKGGVTADRIRRQGEDNRDRRGRLLGGDDVRHPVGDDDIHLSSDKLPYDLGRAFASPVAPAVDDAHGSSLRPAKVLKALNETGGEWGTR